MKPFIVEKIQPLSDHLMLGRFCVGDSVDFRGRPYTVVSHTTLASGEPALVLQGQGEQFAVGASQFFAGTSQRALGESHG